jgi:hypothetical protein
VAPLVVAPPVPALLDVAPPPGPEVCALLLELELVPAPPAPPVKVTSPTPSACRQLAASATPPMPTSTALAPCRVT